MKITRDPEKFRPVTIVLETAEEVDSMYHIMNCGTSMPLVEYVKEYCGGIPNGKVIDFQYRMYEKLAECRP